MRLRDRGMKECQSKSVSEEESEEVSSEWSMSDAIYESILRFLPRGVRTVH